MVVKNSQPEKCSVKKLVLNNQVNSGMFVDSAYMPKGKDKS